VLAYFADSQVSERRARSSSPKAVVMRCGTESIDVVLAIISNPGCRIIGDKAALHSSSADLAEEIHYFHLAVAEVAVAKAR
jgi:hypothetical protein